MEIVDAHWDERNLGLKTFEIILSDTDSLADFLREEERLIREKGARYLVLKTQANKPELLFGLPQANYQFVETAFRLILRKADYKCPPFITRLDRNVEVRATTDLADLQRIYGEISAGMFNTDRVAIDPRFSKELAARRYVGWIDSLVKQGTPIHEVLVQGKPVGFFLLKRIDADLAQGILTGLYEQYAPAGYGVLIMKKLNDAVWDAGYRTYLAQVSSNNGKALRTNLMFGSEIESFTYTYVKVV
jgi:hypothetical protein